MPTASNSQFIVLPRGEHCKVCKIENKRIIDLALLPWPANGRFTIGEAGWIACITRKGRSISITKLEANNKLITRPTISLPDKYKARVTAIAGDIMYVGGACGEEVLGLYNLSHEKLAWISLDVPKKLKRKGKRIDDLLLDGNRLIAVDNIVFPKWMLVYDVADPENPKLIDVSEIPHHGTYEHIIMGSIGSHWVALFSATIGMSGAGQHIAIFDKEDLKERGCITTMKRTYREDELTWKGVAFLDDLLIIPSGNKGIGVVDLSRFHSENDFPNRFEQELHYSFPKQLSAGEVLKIIPILSRKEIVVILKAQGCYETAVLTKDNLEHQQDKS